MTSEIRNQSFKIILAGILFLGAAVLQPSVGHTAQKDYQDTCATIEGTDVGEPSPLAILCPIATLFNVVLYSSGAIFVVFIFIASIKYSMSQGDPKALQGSRQTLTMAIVGFIVVVGSFTILIIIKNVLGLSDNPIINPFKSLNDGLVQLFDEMGIKNY